MTRDGGACENGINGGADEDDDETFDITDIGGPFVILALSMLGAVLCHCAARRTHTAKEEPDDSRPVIYQGQAAMMTPAGQLPLNFEIEADSLAAAADAFADQVQEEARRVIEELRDLQRKQELSSPILQPGDPRMGGMGGGGMGGGGKIQL